MSVLNVKVLREIKNNFKAYLSVILIATLAVTLFTGIWANYKNFDARLNVIYEKSNMCDGIVMVKEPNSASNDEIEDFLEKQNVEYEKRLYFPTKTGSDNIYLVTFASDSKLNQPYQVSTETFDSSMVFVDENFLNRKHLKIGDSFDIPFQVSGLDFTIELTVSGTMTHPESLENSAYNPAFIYVGEEAFIQAVKEGINVPFVTEDFIKNFLQSRKNQYLIRGNDGIFDQIKEQFEDEILYSLKRSDLPSNMTVDADVTQARQLIYIFPVIFYLVAILIILTSISQLIHREQKNIGILKALGFSQKEILFHYMKIFIVLGLIGSVLGIILGPLIVPNVMGHKYDILYQLPKISLPFFRWEYLISVAILIVITALTSFFACHESLKMVPAASLRGDNSVQMHLSFFARFPLFHKISLTILMAFRNMKRKISRTLMVVIGVLGCSALLACGFGIEDTIHYGLDLELDELIPYDISVTYSDYQKKSEKLEEISDVRYVDEYAKYAINVEKKNLISSYIYLLPENSQVFTPDYTDETLIVSGRVAEEIGCKTGDEITFVYNNRKYTAKVDKIIDFCVSQGLFVSQNRFDEIPFEPTGAWIKTEDVRKNDRISSDIEAMDGVLSTQTMAEMRDHAEQTISSIKVMTLTIKIFAILLAVVVLYNLALLNFKERTKDIATLKVLGFSRFEVAASFMIEILFLTFVGALLGLSLGYPLLYAVLSINENPLIAYIYHIDWASYGWTILITCGSGLLINLLFALLTNKIQMVESLKSVE